MKRKKLLLFFAFKYSKIFSGKKEKFGPEFKYASLKAVKSDMEQRLLFHFQNRDKI